MFTGIVTDIGIVSRLHFNGDLRVRVGSNYNSGGIANGASIACDGVCLTVIAAGCTNGQNWFDFDVSAETLSKTNLGDPKTGWSSGKSINLERALRLGDELGGHIVSGHVDGIAEVADIRDEGDSTRVSLIAPKDLAKFIAVKGSVALNGTSLTVNEVQGARFGVNIIPHTKSVTTWGDMAVGNKVNIEVDTIARYIARLSEMQGQ